MRGQRARAPPRSKADSRRPARYGPARPRRWSADALRDPRAVSSRLIPDTGSNAGRRSYPPSTTMRTPSIVRLVSATFVASTTLRRPCRLGAQRRVLRRRGELAVERHGRAAHPRRAGPTRPPPCGGSRRRPAETRAGRPRGRASARPMTGTDAAIQTLVLATAGALAGGSFAPRTPVQAIERPGRRRAHATGSRHRASRT